MSGREIPREDWVRFLDRFSEEHRGWRVNVEVQTEGGARLEVEALPLVGVSAECKGSAAPAIEIAAGTGAEAHLTHRVADPTCLRMLETDGGEHESLEIVSASAGRVFVRFDPPKRPPTAHVL